MSKGPPLRALGEGRFTSPRTRVPCPGVTSIVIPPRRHRSLTPTLDHTLIDAWSAAAAGYNTLWLPAWTTPDRHAEGGGAGAAKRAYSATTGPGASPSIGSWPWNAESGGKILAKWRRLGDSWMVPQRFTIDEGLSRRCRPSSSGSSTTA